MKLLEHKQRELQRVANEIQRLSQGNPQQQRKCTRLKEDHKKLMQEIQKLQEDKDEKILDELSKQRHANEKNERRKNEKRRKLETEYENGQKALGIGEEHIERAHDSNENTLSFKTDENIYLDVQHPKLKPIQKDQYGVYEQVINMKKVEKRMLKRKKIESEVKYAFSTGTTSLCELEADIANMTKRKASPVIQKFEEELKIIRTRSSNDTELLKTKIAKLERRINKINEAREICVTSISEMNLTTKRMLFDFMGFVVNILRNVLYTVAWVRDTIVSYTENK